MSIVLCICLYIDIYVGIYTYTSLSYVLVRAHIPRNLYLHPYKQYNQLFMTHLEGVADSSEVGESPPAGLDGAGA